MNSRNSRPSSPARPQDAATRREDRPARGAMFRRLQWVALVIRNAGPGAGPRLAWLTPDGSVRQCAIPQDRPLIAGRDSAADVHEDHIRFSRRHFEIAAGPDGFVLRDTASRNGTRVNGRRIQNRLLRDGDMIEAGRKIFVFLLR